ncbi:exosortase [Rivibacter subsaxonicus]|uniref:Exosortase B n=1 Tax=Rivibacter subsaxonicus TaxID=457575 RepID=A0A4Q7VP30_9BURK|nr:exosortase [Rivibacter subsaxonicus]RZT98153.1 exosortase B [Rivibacter subsaxonicus]
MNSLVGRTLINPGTLPTPVDAIPPRADWAPAAILATGFALLVLSLMWDWPAAMRADAAQGHEPFILAVSAFLLYRRRVYLFALPAAPATVLGGALFCAGLLLFVLGQAYDVRLSLVSLMMILAAVLLILKGPAALRASWFPVLFTLFALPLPLDFVLAITGPMKQAVSQVATWLLDLLGYPIGRAGVVITIGQYQLLVTEACAGLQTMFTLEAMGLLYANLVSHGSVLRSTLLAVLTPPIAFMANVVRVVVLALITWYLGDGAGQGFLHGFSGIVLFMVALAMVIGLDSALARLPSLRGRSK